MQTRELSIPDCAALANRLDTIDRIAPTIGAVWKAAKSSISRYGWWPKLVIVAGSVVLLVSIIGTLVWIDIIAGASPEDEARWACQDAAKGELGSQVAEPIDFSGAEISDETANGSGENTWRVSGTIEADVSGGDVVSAGYTCTVTGTEVADLSLELGTAGGSVR